MPEYSAKRAALSRVVEKKLTQTNRNMHESLAVVPVKTVAEGLQLPDGRVMVVQVAQPVQRFAIALRSGDSVEIVKLYDQESEAVTAAEQLAVQLESLVPQGVVQ